MAGIGHRGFMGRKTGGIPIPEAGVCTPYPIAIPITSGLLSYVSAFNFCDQFLDLSASSPITVSGDPVRNSNDLSVSGNDELSLSDLSQPCSYIDSGSGDVYFEDEPSTLLFRAWSPNIAWRINTDVKTVIALVNSDDITSSGVTRFGFHGTNSQLRFIGSNISWRSNSIDHTSSISASSSTWFVMSIRTNDNVVLGVDKSYEEVRATAPTITNSDFSIWGPTRGALTDTARWQGKVREIAIYSGSLSDSDLDTMVDYMKAKWNL